MTSIWPETPSTSRPGETVRKMLDYVCWIARDMETLGSHGGTDLEHWRRQVGAAYRALVNPMVSGFGDPYPMDVPPARSPGLWPDVAAADIPGMTVRHQLVVIGLLAEQSRTSLGVRTRPEVLIDLERRISRARTALDHGPSRPMPAEARSTPSPEVLAAIAAEEQAVRAHARRRSRRERAEGRSGHAKPAPKPAAKPASKPAFKPTSRQKSAKPAAPKRRAQRKPVRGGRRSRR